MILAAIIVTWYAIGLLASIVGMAHMNAMLDRIFPQYAPHRLERSDKVFMATIAMGGPINAVAVFVYCLLPDPD